MFVPPHSDRPSFPSVQHMERALLRLKQGVSTHLERESQLHQMFAACQEKWLAQIDQLRLRIEMLEAPGSVDDGCQHGTTTFRGPAAGRRRLTFSLLRPVWIRPQVRFLKCRGPLGWSRRKGSTFPAYRSFRSQQTKRK